MCLKLVILSTPFVSLCFSGMVKTYQLGKFTKFGSSIKIAPVTTETQLNEDTCLQVNGSREMMIEPQGIVPDLSGFEVCIECFSVFNISIVLYCT